MNGKRREIAILDYTLKYEKVAQIARADRSVNQWDETLGRMLEQVLDYMSRGKTSSALRMMAPMRKVAVASPNEEEYTKRIDQISGWVGKEFATFGWLK